MNNAATGNVIEQLARWAKYSEQYFFELGDTGTGYYGTGYSRWGTQTQQKYCSAIAVLGVIGKDYGYDNWEWGSRKGAGSTSIHT